LRSGVPITVDLTLALEGAAATVDVVGHVEDLLERDPTAHTDIDQSLIARLPLESSSGLNQVITLASPGVVSDSNGFFHPIGDHAQTQFSIDNQPVTDQQSRVYSNQISPDAVQSMEIITGVAPAEYGGQEQPGRAHRDQVGSGSAQADRQRRGGATARSRARRGKPTSAADRIRSATSCRSAACGRIASSTRPSSAACTIGATPCRSSTGWTRTPAPPARST